MRKRLWKNTDFLPKKGLFQFTRKRERKKERNETPVSTLMVIWILFLAWKLCINKNINIMFFTAVEGKKTYVEKLEMTIIHYSKFPQPLSEFSVGIRNVQCFLINLIYTVGWWNATNNHNIDNSSPFPLKPFRCSQGPHGCLFPIFPWRKLKQGLWGWKKSHEPESGVPRPPQVLPPDSDAVS